MSSDTTGVPALDSPDSLTGEDSSARNATVAEELAEEVAEKVKGRGRYVVAVAGEPGSGKSTLVAHVAAALSRRGITAAVLPMDGFHLSNAVLISLGRRNRKGALDTFDGDGFVALLHRIVQGEPRTIYAPDFQHGFGEPIAGALAIEPDVQVVLTEGNYLLDPTEPWAHIRDVVDDTWYVDLDPTIRKERLQARHVASGKDPEQAARWIEAVDEKNAERIRSTRMYAHRVITRF